MQTWVKLKKIFEPNNESWWLHSHAAVPFIDASVSDDGLLIYFSSRDAQGKSYTGQLRVNPETFDVINVSHEPVLSPGSTGMFDSDGAMGCHITEINGGKYLYYIGWNRGHDVPFHNAIGVAVWSESGKKFVKVSEGPILDRSIYDPAFTASNTVINVGGVYRMYYLSGIKWEHDGPAWKHHYNIKIAHSRDGIDWQRNGATAIDFRYPNEYAISVPCVLFEDGGFKMWYSYRGGPFGETYRIGYAESDDGLVWVRKDEEVIFDVSRDSWDSEMLCYPHVFDYRGNRYMLYNGNGYGRTGFGIAQLHK
jgi:hypothetical protein